MKALAAALLVAAAAPAVGQQPAGAGKPPGAGAAQQPSPADAAAQASAHYRKGVEHYKEARYREAIAEFDEAYRIKPHGVVQYNLAQCHEKLGDIPAALRAYREYLRAVPDAKDRKTVEMAMANLAERLGATGKQQVRVYSEPPGAEVLVDGAVAGRTPAALLLSQGKHQVALRAAGYVKIEREVALGALASLDIDVQMQKDVPLPPPPGSTAPPPKKAPAPRPRVWTWVAAGVAGAAIVAGGYYGMQAKKAADDLHNNVHLSGEAVNLQNQASSNAHKANVFYVAGAVAAAGAGALFMYEGKF